MNEIPGMMRTDDSPAQIIYSQLRDVLRTRTYGEGDYAQAMAGLLALVSASENESYVLALREKLGKKPDSDSIFWGTIEAVVELLKSNGIWLPAQLQIEKGKELLGGI